MFISPLIRASTKVSSYASALIRHPPFIFEPGLSIEWPSSHTFAMWKFDDLASFLLGDSSDSLVSHPSDFVGLDLSDHLEDGAFLRCHSEDYYFGFLEDTLPPNLNSRIGFTKRPDHGALVRRTKLECSCTVSLNYHSALNISLLCKFAGCSFKSFVHGRLFIEHRSMSSAR